MSVLNRDEFMTRLKERIGEDTSDEAVTFIEDFTDTYDDLEKRTNDTNNEYEEKYKEAVREKEELDKAWREKYKSRFFDEGTTPEEVKDEQKENVIYDGETKTFEDLFEEREG